MTPVKKYALALALCTLWAGDSAAIQWTDRPPSSPGAAFGGGGASLPSATTQTLTILGANPNFSTNTGNQDFTIQITNFISLTLKKGTSMTGTPLSIIQAALQSSSQQPLLLLRFSSSSTPASTSAFSVQGDSNGNVTSITLTRDFTIQNPTQKISTLLLGSGSTISKITTNSGPLQSFFSGFQATPNISIRPASNSYVTVTTSNFTLDASNGSLNVSQFSN